MSTREGVSKPHLADGAAEAQIGPGRGGQLGVGPGTDDGADRPRPVRARAKMTRTRPKVATTSDKKWAGVARWWAEIVTAALENITLATSAPALQPAT